jgi:hypothetical protein
MFKIMKVPPSSFRRPDFEVGLAFGGDPPVGAICPQNSIANEIVITFGTRNDGAEQAIKDLSIL